jgi:hypothetical protein
MREEFRRNVGRYYHGAAHFAFTVSVSLGTCAALLLQVRGLRAAELLAIPAFFLFCCLIEYLEHRYLLHRRQPFAPIAYQIHTLEHHKFYTEEDFHPESHRDFAFVLFPPALVVGYVLIIVAPFTLLFHGLISPNAGFLVGATAGVFFFLYEMIHFASHLGDRFPLRWSVLRSLGAHHRLHHRASLMGGYNFNVVCPVFDWLFGTLKRAEPAP